MATSDKMRSPRRSNGFADLPESKAKATRAVAMALMQPRYAHFHDGDPEPIARTISSIMEITARYIPTAVMFRLPAKELGALIDGVAEAEQAAWRQGWVGGCVQGKADAEVAREADAQVREDVG